MNDFYSMCDESFNNVYDYDFFSIIDEDRYEDEMSEENYEDCVDDLYTADDSTPRGTSSCSFATSSRRNFDNFYDYLRSQGFNIMKSRETFPYRMDVFDLTKEDADWLTKVFCANRRLVPKDSFNRVA